MEIKKSSFPSILVAFIVLILGLSACKSTDSLPDIGTNTPKSTEELESIRDQIGEPGPITRGSGMNDSELLADINNCDDFFACFAPDVGFVVTSIQINQRDTRKKESDEIYASITSVNPFSSFTAEFYLYYKYYSTGGWRLETLWQNSDGIYTINYWPNEDDLYAVWADTYSEVYDNGIIETCEIESTGNDYVMFLVNYSNFSEIATRYQKAEVRFGFADGLWTTASMLCPGEFEAGDPHWELHSDIVRGMYMGTSSDDNSITVIIENFYTDVPDTSLHPTELRVDVYRYYVNSHDFQADFSASSGKTVGFDFYSVEGAYTGDSKLKLKDGIWYNGGIQMEHLEDFPDAPLSEEDARSLIQDVVESNGFTYWDNSNVAQQAMFWDMYQSRLQKLTESSGFDVYRQACIDYYSQLDLTFPDDLDPCMYTQHLLMTDKFAPLYEGISNGIFDEELAQELMILQTAAPSPGAYIDMEVNPYLYIEDLYGTYCMAKGIN